MTDTAIIFDDLRREFADVIEHYGTLHKSGRYPWGSGENGSQRHADFLDQVDQLRKKGLTETEIAKGLGLDTTTQLRALNAIAKNEKRKGDQMTAAKLKAKGMSNTAIGQQMGLNESSVRALLQPANQEKASQLNNTADFLKKQVEEKSYLDVGAGAEQFAGVSRTQMNTAIAMLREQGYNFHYIKVDQLGTGQKTTLKILAPPTDDIKSQYRDIAMNQDKIKGIAGYSEDNGRTFKAIEKPVDVDSKRISVRYGSEGGADRDGVIELRRGVDDISMGAARYAQVRISVDGTHYLKGMAMYADDLPDGVDIRFNTNKENKTGNKLDAMKPQKDDEDNPFGAIIRQRTYVDPDGKQKLSALNIVGSEDPNGVRYPGEEGGWAQWSKSLSSQVLSKQSLGLAKQQLDLALKTRQEEYDEIMSLTNPAVKRRLLESFSDGADSAAVRLRGAALPRQGTHVILPMNTMKETDVYAPNFRNGEKVVLIRYPHGGIFEIPELTVNNKAPEPNRLIKGAKDAVGINAKVAARLSGADFDGDTVLVIPNNNRQIKTAPPLKGLEGFEPQKAYPAYEGMKVMSPRTKQIAMGDVSNLITDMTIRGATQQELARAVRHSMVVIDAEKHKLNYRQSAKDNGIAELKKKYQGRSNSGATTLISQASSPTDVLNRKARPAAEGGAIDPATGKKVYKNTDEHYVVPAHQRVSAKGRVTEVPEKTVYKTFKAPRMAVTDDARTLSSGTPIEEVYADHANKLKALANEARKSYLGTPSQQLSPSARKTYANEVGTLKAKLNVAQKNSPLERQAQVIAGAVVKAKQQANPEMDAAELKKIKGLALVEARNRMGAKKQRIDITPREWEAIQAGAISNNFLDSILRNTDLDRVKELATPRESKAMSPAKIALAKARIASGYTQSEVADSLGISTSTLNASLR